MYEEIPEGIHAATAWFQTAIQKVTADFQKPVSDMTQLKTEIEKLTRQTKQSAENAEMSRTRISQELALVDESLESINSSVKEGTEKAAATVSERMTELLSGALEKAMPLSDLKKAGKTFSEAVRESEQASAELRENVKTIKRARFRTLAVAFALTFIFAILGTGGFFYSWSERRIEDWRVHYLRQIADNHNIVLRLSESNRRLIWATNDDGSKLLVMENATGETRNNHGVIKFR
jgi:cell division septum initiation protein DivIVA